MDVAGSTIIQERVNKLPQGPIRYFDKAGYTPETLEDKIDEYFEKTKPEIITNFNQGKPIDKLVKIYTLPGLCLWLGYNTMKGYIKAMENEENAYSPALKRGYLKIQEFTLKLAYVASNPSGPIFGAKNLGFTDQVTVDNRSSDGSMSPKPTIVTHTKEQDKEAYTATMKLFTGKNTVNQEAVPVS